MEEEVPDVNDKIARVVATPSGGMLGAYTVPPTPNVVTNVVLPRVGDGTHAVDEMTVK
jgi:hypothetical protein